MFSPVVLSFPYFLLNILSQTLRPNHLLHAHSFWSLVGSGAIKHVGSRRWHISDLRRGQHATSTASDLLFQKMAAESPPSLLSISQCQLGNHTKYTVALGCNLFSFPVKPPGTCWSHTGISYPMCSLVLLYNLTKLPAHQRCHVIVLVSLVPLSPGFKKAFLSDA